MQQQTVENFFQHFLKSGNLLHLESQLKTKIGNLNTVDPQQHFLTKTIKYLNQNNEQQSPENKYSFKFQMITVLHPIAVQVFSQLAPQIQQATRSGLLNAVVELNQSLKCISALGLLIRQIMEIDGATNWFQPFSQLLKWIVSGDIRAMEAGIQLFIYILKQTPYTSNNNEMPFYKIASPLLQVLFQVFAQSQLTQPIREKLLYLALHVIRTFSVFDGNQDSIVKFYFRDCFDKTYEIWMSLFVSALQSSLHSHLTIKKYIMKILVVIFRDMPKYSEKNIHQYVGTIWEFVYKIVPMYLSTVVWDTSQSKQFCECYYDEDPESIMIPIQSLIHSSLQFLSVMVSTPQMSVFVRISIHHLMNVLFHCMIITRFQVSTWQDNPSHFMTYTGMIESEAGLRGKALAMINELIEKYNDIALQAILLICQKFLMNYREAHTSQIILNFYQQLLQSNKNQQLPESLLSKYESLVKLSSVDCAENLKVKGEDWRKIQVALVVLARFAEDIIVFQSKQQALFDIQSFVKGLIKQIHSPDYYPILRGQSLYTLMRFTQIISIKYKQLFVELLIASVKCISNSLPLSVRVVGAKALITFSRKIQKQKISIGKSNGEILMEWQPIHNIVTLQLISETIHPILEGLIELIKIFNGLNLDQHSIREVFRSITAQYLLKIFHKFNSHSSTMLLYFNLLNGLCSIPIIYRSVLELLLTFSKECLLAYENVVGTEQRKFIRSGDIDLINLVLRITNLMIGQGSKHHQQNTIVNSKIIELICQILQKNEQVSIHVSLTICLKNIMKYGRQALREDGKYLQKVTNSIRSLLKIPIDKTFQSASLYTGNLTLLADAALFPKPNYQILQEVVLKVFRSRTPSVIQSLVLIYSTMINRNTNPQCPFNPHHWQKTTSDVVDFLASFSIQNRMGLKILIDKWLLQQSLFRGKYTKISTFMALSKLFLLRDKRVDNLLVIGFNPSHTQVCNDVTAPLKILATLIRCLDNQLRKDENGEEQEEEMGMKEENTGQVQVELEKFKEEEQGTGIGGGLADRENQQGSTCYMSAMLEFYDDGEQCDQTTEEDLIFLKDSSTNFQLADYLLQFFTYLNTHHHDYLKHCLKGLMKQDLKSLNKYIKIDIEGI